MEFRELLRADLALINVQAVIFGESSVSIEIAGFHRCSSVFYVLKIPAGTVNKNQQLLIVFRFGKNIRVFTKAHFPPPDKILLRALNLTHHGFAICQTAR